MRRHVVTLSVCSSNAASLVCDEAADPALLSAAFSCVALAESNVQCMGLIQQTART